MIISASRRTDIPALYAEWFMNRMRAGFCTVRNPFNADQISRVSLLPEDVDVIVFWTRNPQPLLAHLDELENRGVRFYVQYTLVDNPRVFEPRGPAAGAALRQFHALAGRIGPERVIWRYDPIIFSTLTDAKYHQATYRRLADALNGYTRRSVISLMDFYAKLNPRFASLAKEGIFFRPAKPQDDPECADMLRGLADCAAAHGMAIQSCAEPGDLRGYGIQPGACVDAAYIREVFGIEVAGAKDPNQRLACACTVSRDIGAYNTCVFGCQYCYATDSFERAQKRFAKHDPQTESLGG